MVAFGGGSMFTKKELLEAESMENTDNQTVYQKFNAAVRSGDVDNLKMAHKDLQAEGINLAQNSVFAAAALRDAIYGGDVDCIKFLIDNGTKVKFQKHLMGDNFLPEAISTFMDRDQDKACEIVNILIDADVDIDVDIKNYQGYTPLMLSAMTGLTGLVDVLLGAGADLDILSTREGIKAEDLAIDKGHLSIAQAILQTRNQREEDTKQQKNDELAVKRAELIQAQNNFRTFIRRRAM